MKKVVVDSVEYVVDVNYKGESDIFTADMKRVNSEISTGLYYAILTKAKSQR